MVILPLFFMLIQHHVGLMASAFQPAQPQLRTQRQSYKHKIKRQWLQPHPTKFYAKSSYNRRSDVLLSATESDSSLNDILEKYAAPLEFKKGGDVSNKDVSSGTGKDVASTTSDGDNASSKVESSLSTTDKVASSNKATDAASFTPSPDTPLANKFYLKKMQLAEEAKTTESTVEEKTAETADTPTTAPPVTAPRRRFADFGIASEAAEPINGETTMQEPGASVNEDSTATTKPRGFSDLSSRPSRPVEVSTEGTGNTASSSPDTKETLRDTAKPTPETKSLGENTKPPPVATTNTDSSVPDTKTVGGTVKPPATSTAKEEKAPAAKSVIKEEQAPAAKSTNKEEKSPAEKSIINEESSPAAKSTIKEEKASAAKSTIKEEKAPAAKSTIKEERPNPNPTTTISQPSSELIKTQLELIKTQLASPINTLKLPSFNNLGAEDFGLLPLFIIGISTYLALGVYLKQVNDTDDGYAGWDEFQKKDGDEKPPGLIGKVTEDSKNLMQKVKDSGTAGAISYALWEAAFWGVSIPVCLVGYRKVTGNWPDLKDSEDVKKIGLEAFAFVNFARFAVPLRIGLALSTVPWVEENILGRFQGVEANDSEEEELKSEEDEEKGGSFRRPQMSSSNDTSGEIEDEDTSAISEVEKRLNEMETAASRISSTALDNINAGIDPALLQKKKKETKRKYVPGNNYLGSIDEYCEPGRVMEDCSEAISGYLDSLASSGAVATDGEVKSIVGYLGSLSSNVSANENTGVAFTSYLDALSTGFIPAPSSAEAVATYLDELSGDDDTTISMSSPPPASQSKEQKMGSRMNEVEERLSRLESSVNNLPDDIASRLVDWQISQDKKLTDEMEKIMKILVDGNSLEK